MSTEYTFFCAELKETLKVKSNVRQDAFKRANDHFKSIFKEGGLTFNGWKSDQTKTVMTAKIS